MEIEALVRVDILCYDFYCCHGDCISVGIDHFTVPSKWQGNLQDRLDSRGTFSEEEIMSDDAKKAHTRYAPESLPVGGLGQRAYLTRRGGWIEIEERPPLFSWRRWTS